MKTINTIILLLITTSVFAQQLSQCGIDNHPQLTQVESDFLSSYMNAQQHQGVDLSGKKVLFITGSGASRIGSKIEYFEQIKSWHEEGTKIATWLVQLNEEERLKSGHDLIITYWVKVLTKRRKRKLLTAVGNASKTKT